MGYYTSFEGEISIDPPLTWAEIKDSPYQPEKAQRTMTPDVKFRVVEEMTETDTGTVTVKYADAIVPIIEDSYKGYDIVKTVQSILDQYGATHSFTGRFDCEGEDAGDLWRLVVRNGRAEKVKPQITWPEGDS